MNSNAVKNFTTTLPIGVLAEIDSAAKDLKVGKNDVLVSAFKAWNRARRQAMVARSYKKVANDPEWRELAEAGLADYLKNLELWEK